MEGDSWERGELVVPEERQWHAVFSQGLRVCACVHVCVRVCVDFKSSFFSWEDFPPHLLNCPHPLACFSCSRQRHLLQLAYWNGLFFSPVFAGTADSRRQRTSWWSSVNIGQIKLASSYLLANARIHSQIAHLSCKPVYCFWNWKWQRSTIGDSVLSRNNWDIFIWIEGIILWL